MAAVGEKKENETTTQDKKKRKKVHFSEEGTKASEKEGQEKLEVIIEGASSQYRLDEVVAKIEKTKSDLRDLTRDSKLYDIHKNLLKTHRKQLIEGLNHVVQYLSKETGKFNTPEERNAVIERIEGAILAKSYSNLHGLLATKYSNVIPETKEIGKPKIKFGWKKASKERIEEELNCAASGLISDVYTDNISIDDIVEKYKTLNSLSDDDVEKLKGNLKRQKEILEKLYTKEQIKNALIEGTYLNLKVSQWNKVCDLFTKAGQAIGRIDSKKETRADLKKELQRIKSEMPRVSLKEPEKKLRLKRPVLMRKILKS